MRGVRGPLVFWLLAILLPAGPAAAETSLCGDAVCTSVAAPTDSGSRDAKTQVSLSTSLGFETPAGGMRQTAARMNQEAARAAPPAPLPLLGQLFETPADALEEESVDLEAEASASDEDGLKARTSATTLGVSVSEAVSSEEFGFEQWVHRSPPGADSARASHEAQGASPGAIEASAATVEPEALPAVDLGVLALAGSTAGASALVAPGWRTTLSRLFKRWGWLGLFTRLDQAQILHNRTRAEMLEYVRSNPGERVETMRRTLNLSNGTMLHHVKMLRQANLLRVVKQGNVARLFRAGPRLQPSPYVPAVRKQILTRIQESPGPTQRQLAEMLQLSERMISYHVRTLEEQGFIHAHRSTGGKNLFVVNPPAAASTSAGFF